MKPTLLFAMLSTVFAVPQAPAMSELEALRAKCAAQEQTIRRLEDQVHSLQSGPSGQTPAASKPATSSSQTPAVAPSTYTVRRGECLEGIARKTGCSPVKLAKANGLKTSSIIHSGQKLKLPGGTSPASTAVVSATAAPATTAATHKVKAGETFASISRKYKVSTSSLLAANPGVKPTSLRAGQMIQLSRQSPTSTPKPAVATAAAKSPAPTRTAVAPAAASPAPATMPVATLPPATAAAAPAPVPTATSKPEPAAAPLPQPAPAEALAKTPEASAAPETTPSPSNPEKKIRSVTIDGEMTYGEFAAKHGTDAGRLNDLNGLDLTNATVLAKGSELYVPAQP